MNGGLYFLLFLTNDDGDDGDRGGDVDHGDFDHGIDDDGDRHQGDHLGGNEGDCDKVDGGDDAEGHDGNVFFLLRNTPFTTGQCTF